MSGANHLKPFASCLTSRLLYSIKRNIDVFGQFRNIVSELVLSLSLAQAIIKPET